MLQGNPVELDVIVLAGVVLAGSLGSMSIRRMFPHGHIDVSLFDGASLMAVLLVIVVALGLSASILTPILPLLMLIGAVRLLPIGGRVRTGFLIIGCLSIAFGAALAAGDLPSSQIAAMKLLGSSSQAAFSGMLWP